MNKLSQIIIAGAFAFTGFLSHAIAQNVYTVTAASITDEFKENELKAEAKYKDAQIIVSGYVSSVGKNGLDEVIINLKDDINNTSGIGVEPTEEALPKVATFSKGDQAKFSCKKADKQLFVHLYSCEVVD